jgi:hypothetical protein
MRSGIRWLQITLLLALLYPCPAAAETIRIVSGVVSIDPDPRLFTLVGDRRGFTLSGAFPVVPQHVAFCDNDGGPCNPGDVADVRAAKGGGDLPVGLVTLDGITYEDVNATSRLYALIGFSSAVLLPPISSTAVLHTPFTMEGSFFHDFELETLLGSGIMTSTWKSSGPDEDGRPFWFLTALRYDFSGAAPIPEPTTLVLAGVAGAAAAFGRRKRRAR